MKIIYPLLLQKAKHFYRQPLFIQLGFVPCWLLLAIAKLLILFLPFKQLAPYLGNHTDIAPWLPILSARQEERARLLGRLIRLTARYTPWDSNCFPQAIVARLLLGVYKIPYVLYFGLMRDQPDDRMKAHAWLAAGRIRVTGGLSFDHFTIVACFATPDISKTCLL